jgi:flagellar motor protein MotB
MKNILALSLFATAILAPIQAGGTSIDLYGAFFKSGHPIKGESLRDSVSDNLELEKLQKSIETLKNFPDMRFEISGHTDLYECQASECNELAQRRAILVFHFFLDAGIDGHRLTKLTEYSWTRPIAGQRSEYRLNQRAEVNITSAP